MAVPRSFCLPASVQPERTRYQRVNHAFRALRSASAVVAVLLVVALASDAALGFMGAPARRSASSEPVSAMMAAPAEDTSGGAGAAELPSEAYPPQAEAPAAPQEAEGARSFSPTEMPAAKAGAPGATAEPTWTPLAPAGMGGEEPSESGSAEPQPEEEPAMAAAAVSATEPAESAAENTADAMPAPAATAAGEQAAPTPETGSEVAIALVESADVTPEPGYGENSTGTSPETPPDTEAWRHEPYWVAWRAIRIAGISLAGLLCVLLGGLFWAAWRRRA